MRISIAFLIVCSSCSSSVTYTNETSDSTSTFRPDTQTINIATTAPQATIDQARLMGAWTDGSTENATFDIGKDSIFYLDEMTSFPYTLKGDSLTIVYPDMSFQGTIQFSGDTLILSDPEFGTTKYTRFTD